MPFFSIITPTYNRAEFLQETVNSVLLQTFQDWELIIVDDGSTDNTRSVLESLSKTDPRIKYMYQLNAERSAARNNGIKNAKGKYICFLDSDDKYLMTHLEVLHHNINLKNTPVALFFTNQKNAINNKIEKVDSPILNKEPILYLFQNSIIPSRVCIHNSILRNELFDNDITIVEDMILWVRIAQNHPIFQIQQDTIIYNLHEGNSINTNNNSAQKRLNGLIVFFERYNHISRNIPQHVINKTLSDTLFKISKYHIFKYSRWKSIIYLLKSIFKHPTNEQTKFKLNILINLLLGKQNKAKKLTK